MFEAKIENVKGDILILTGKETDYQIVSIQGLNPPNAQINTSTVAGLDGALYNSSKLQPRNIVIALKLNGFGSNVEKNRQLLYTFFATKEWCKFYYKNENRNVYIESYVETFECNLFENGQMAQISLLCPQSYFKSMNEIIDDISKVISVFEFPFAHGSNNATNPYIIPDEDTDDAIPFSEIELDKITNVYNNSECETGLIIEITVLDTINKVEIRNTVTGESFILNYEFIAEDKIIINTNKGQKSVVLVRNGITYNIFTEIQKGSKFFQLSIGDNFFSYIIDEGENDTSVGIIFKHYNLFRGV